MGEQNQFFRGVFYGMLATLVFFWGPVFIYLWLTND